MKTTALVTPCTHPKHRVMSHVHPTRRCALPTTHTTPQATQQAPCTPAPPPRHPVTPPHATPGIHLESSSSVMCGLYILTSSTNPAGSVVSPAYLRIDHHAPPASQAAPHTCAVTPPCPCRACHTSAAHSEEASTQRRCLLMDPRTRICTHRRHCGRGNGDADATPHPPHVELVRPPRLEQLLLQHLLRQVARHPCGASGPPLRGPTGAACRPAQGLCFDPLAPAS